MTVQFYLILLIN